MVDTQTVRKLWRRLEPCHAFIYFAPEAGLNYAELGLSGEAGYFVSRSAPMGAVDAETVIATFFNFKPELVRSAMADAWTTVTPDQVLAARFDAADKALRRMLGDDVDHPDLAEAAGLARRAAEACTPQGRPLYAGTARLAWPNPPHLQLFHAVTLLREYRGDGHVAALTLAGFDAVEALVSHVASPEVGLPVKLVQATRGWNDEEWQAGIDRLRARGQVADGDELALTEAGRAARQEVEDRTDQATLPPWAALDQTEADRLRTVVAPFAKKIGAAMFG